MSKMCRKGMKPRHFFLFNDILVYGDEIARGTYSGQKVLNLSDLSITDLGDTEDGKNCLQINHKTKSFQVFAPSLSDKMSWIALLKKHISICSGRDAEAAIEARAVWVPDAKSDKCQVCKEREFNFLNRRHHCRKCGRVCCGPCSNKNSVLKPGGKPERVCVMCFLELERGTAVGGAKKDSMVGMTVNPLLQPKKVEEDKIDSDASYDSDEDKEVQDIKKGNPNLSDADKKMHEMSDTERMALMFAVRDGKISVDAARDAVTSIAPISIRAPPPRPTAPPSAIAADTPWQPEASGYGNPVEEEQVVPVKQVPVALPRVCRPLLSRYYYYYTSCVYSSFLF